MTKEEIEKKLIAAKEAYYKSGDSDLTDAEYDALVEEYNTLYPDSEFLKDGLQETLAGVSKKYKLPATMGTLAKCMDEKSFKKYWDSHPHTDVVVEEKIDGCGALLEYKNGELTFVYSRGDTEYGEDLTANVSKVRNVPAKLKENWTGHIRGEVVMKRSVFNLLYKNVGKNPRNMTAGIIKRLDGEGCDNLNFIAYDMFDSSLDQKENKKLEFLMNNGFEVPKFMIEATYDEIIKWRNSLETDGETPCDGLVIKQNRVNKEDLARRTPMNNWAFKPAPNIRTTKVTRITWQLAGSQFAPVAIVEPVELDGTTVERATLNNINFMNSIGIYEGAYVSIKKSGMIIPQIIDVANPKQNAFEIPEQCPVCGGEVKVNDSGFPICLNPNCQRKLAHRFAKMFDILGIKGCGEAFLHCVELECGSVKEFLELALAEDRIIDKWAGGINGRKIVKQLKKALDTPITIPQFLATFDYHGFDEKKIKLIDKNLEEMYNLSISDLASVNGFGLITAKLFKEFLTTYRSEIEELIPFFKFKSSSEEKKSAKLDGLSFCFTGAAVMPRSKLQAMVEENGGINKTGVAKGLSYLVTDDTESGSSKNVKAKALGIPVISSTEFLNMLK